MYFIYKLYWIKLRIYFAVRKIFKNVFTNLVKKIQSIERNDTRNATGMHINSDNTVRRYRLETKLQLRK